MKRLIFILFCVLCFGVKSFTQNIDLDKYEIHLGDTIISKSDFIKNGSLLDSSRLKNLQFMPIADGQKIIYYLNGKVYSQGTIKNGKRNGYWKFWNLNGNEAREGNFVDGKPDGTHKYWYEDGHLRGIGNWKDGVYDGEWNIYNEDGTKTTQVYKNGKLIK
ncbi:toxin-antitoxin system YwqK family antitoxin [Arachidicoccus soli]|uniref:Toxin-antitoxin system YwqK family antitoxin n=1 Tax=Arachidicoccus soli TaxID=2341117 RepID=A0A386HKW1_9BACT|nr:hypothetical protein [Arachidicoccus soli]AYD46405.1 hypothetical protein D6B99_01485 [Arachidicoccus soli]